MNASPAVAHNAVPRKDHTRACTPPALLALRRPYPLYGSSRIGWQGREK